MLFNDSFQHQGGQAVVPHALGIHHSNGAVAGQGCRESRQQVLSLGGQQAQQQGSAGSIGCERTASAGGTCTQRSNKGSPNDGPLSAGQSEIIQCAFLVTFATRLHLTATMLRPLGSLRTTRSTVLPLATPPQLRRVYVFHFQHPVILLRSLYLLDSPDQPPKMHPTTTTTTQAAPTCRQLSLLTRMGSCSSSSDRSWLISCSRCDRYSQQRWPLAAPVMPQGLQVAVQLEPLHIIMCLDWCAAGSLCRSCSGAQLLVRRR